MREILILGGYGNFGKRIATALARRDLPVIIAGRSLAAAQALAAKIRDERPVGYVESVAIDADGDLDAFLHLARPKVVVNASGPFQGKDYRVAKSCIDAGAHYVDLADGRDFLGGVSALDQPAKAAGVSVISGASTVPGLASAVLDRYAHEFASLESLRYGISPGQKAERGLATTQAILSYVGKALRPVAGDNAPRYGWADAYAQTYPELGARWVANCDVPDLDLFPQKYGLGRIQFSAGVENPAVFWGLWLLGRCVRAGLPLNLQEHAPFLWRAAKLLDPFGSDAGGMHMIMQGTDHDGAAREIKWFIVAKDGDGPQIPTVPAIILARRLFLGEFVERGARPCVSLVSLEDYLDELRPYSIATFETRQVGSAIDAPSPRGCKLGCLALR